MSDRGRRIEDALQNDFSSQRQHLKGTTLFHGYDIQPRIYIVCTKKSPVWNGEADHLSKPLGHSPSSVASRRKFEITQNSLVPETIA